MVRVRVRVTGSVTLRSLLGKTLHCGRKVHYCRTLDLPNAVYGELIFPYKSAM